MNVRNKQNHALWHQDVEESPTWFITKVGILLPKIEWEVIPKDDESRYASE